MHRRTLEPKQEVLIIYNQEIGFTEDKAIFLRYEPRSIGETTHNIPIFECNDRELTGLECFWILPNDIRSPKNLERLQYELISVQLKALEIAIELDYDLPVKIKDRKLYKMAEDAQNRIESVIKKLGFDPRDESWIETDLADNTRETNWFIFERENGLIFTEKWDDIVTVFNTQFNDTVSVDQAKNMSKKRMRYILGAYHTRMRGNPQKEDWMDAARAFEKKHRERENRMLTWTLAHKNRFPLVKVKQSVQFFSGPFFTEISEKVPHLFTDTHFNKIREGVILRVISYDPQDKYIRLDFTAEIRNLIHKYEDKEPWLKDSSDYDMWVKPEEVASHLEPLEPL
jgi:hypothetical protein